MVSGCGVVGLSADAWVGWDEETTYGTQVGPGGSTEFALFQSESMRGQVNIREAPNIASAHSDVDQSYIGSQVVQGDVTMNMVYEGFEDLMLHALGAITSSSASASGTFIRTFDLSNKGRYKHATSPSLSVHVSRGVVGSGASNPSVFSYLGCVVDAIQFRCTRDGQLDVTVSFFGREESLATSGQAFSGPSGPVINGTECNSQWGGTNIPVTEFTINMRRQVDTERFFLGNTKSCEPPMGKYEVTVDLVTEWDNEVRAGSATMRADYVARTQRALTFDFTSTDDISGTSQKYTFNIELPVALITAFPPNVTGPGRVTVPVSFKGWTSDTTAVPYELRIVNKASSSFSE